MAPDVTGVVVDRVEVEVVDQAFLAEIDGPGVVELIRPPERAAMVEVCDALAAASVSLERLDAPSPQLLDRLDDAVSRVSDPSLAGLAEHLAELREPGRVTEAGARAMSRATAACRTGLVPGWVTVYTPPADLDLLPPSSPAIDLAALGTVQTLEDTTRRLTGGLLPGAGLSPVIRFEVAGQAVFIWTAGDSACVGVGLSGGGGQTQCGAPASGVSSVITQPLDDGSDRVLHVWRLRDATARYVTAEVDGAVFVQETRGGFAAFVTPPGDPRFSVVDQS